MKNIGGNECESAEGIAVLNYIKDSLEKEIKERKSFKHHARLVIKGLWVAIMITLYAFFSDKNIPHSKIMIVVGILFTKDKVIDILKIRKNRKKIFEADEALSEYLK